MNNEADINGFRGSRSEIDARITVVVEDAAVLSGWPQEEEGRWDVDREGQIGFLGVAKDGRGGAHHGGGENWRRRITWLLQTFAEDCAKVEAFVVVLVVHLQAVVEKLCELPTCIAVLQ